ncbi:MAG: anaerobic ribonucleoside-triphosphate reductase activating protein [Syntrophaceae bacterium]|nr:anaerobic ribonucleoside-triphosphate reductase activating protein [Syntrophaceae bacterium]
MEIGGLQKFSLIDYPGKICAVVFTQGCNFRCPYCHNPELADPRLYGTCIPEEELFHFLAKRQGKLDAVTITGGEPTIHSDLIEFVESTRAMDFLIKIDTNGSHPEVIERLIGSNLIDYIAMDVKAPLERYAEITESRINPANIEKSIRLIMNSAIDYEFRTTIARSLLCEKDLLKIGEAIKGAGKLFLQRFVPSKTLDKSFAMEKTYSDEEFEGLKELLKGYVDNVAVR